MPAALLMALAFAAAVFAAEPLGETARAYWGKSVGQACWEKVENARRYEVRLYENDIFRRKVTVSTRQADLAQYMIDGNMYTFEVRAVPTDSQRGTYSSGEWVPSEGEQLAKGLGDMRGRFRDYLSGRKYEKGTGGFVVNQWYMIEGKWYYFNADGYMATGWQQLDGRWYYLGGNGVMMTGWQQIDGSWYYFYSDGAMAVGWVETSPGRWYYLGGDGRMLSDTVVDGYRLDSSGMWVS